MEEFLKICKSSNNEISVLLYSYNNNLDYEKIFLDITKNFEKNLIVRKIYEEFDKCEEKSLYNITDEIQKFFKDEIISDFIYIKFYKFLLVFIEKLPNNNKKFHELINSKKTIHDIYVRSIIYYLKNFLL